jgi:hypothetical protein
MDLLLSTSVKTHFYVIHPIYKIKNIIFHLVGSRLKIKKYKSQFGFKKIFKTKLCPT